MEELDFCREVGMSAGREYKHLWRSMNLGPDCPNCRSSNTMLHNFARKVLNARKRSHVRQPILDTIIAMAETKHYA